MIENLFSKKLLIVTGKGGVGKTTVSLALGLMAAERGLRALVVEVNSEETVAHLLQRPSIGPQEVELLPNLYGINITPKKSFEEYVLLQIKFKSLYKAVFENRFVRYFLEAAPGLSDLMCIGKIYSLVDRYDLVIVDAPATGHGLALLDIATIVTRAVRVGPLKTEAQKVADRLHDPSKTQVVLVTLPEEMPVTEALEMKAHLKNKMEMSVGALILNQYQKSPFSVAEEKELEKFLKDETSLKEKVELLLTRSRLSQEYKEELQCDELMTIPFVASSGFGLPEIQSIASALEEGGE